MIKLTLNWLSYHSDVKCQPLGHSKCDKICDTDSYNKQTRKVLIFKPKAPSFHAIKFSSKNFFPQKIYQIFGFWAGKSLKLRKNTCSCGFNSSLAVNSQVAIFTLLLFNDKHENLTVTKATRKFVNFRNEFLYAPNKVAIVDNYIVKSWPNFLELMQYQTTM